MKDSFTQKISSLDNNTFYCKKRSSVVQSDANCILRTRAAVLPLHFGRCGKYPGADFKKKLKELIQSTKEREDLQSRQLFWQLIGTIFVVCIAVFESCLTSFQLSRTLLLTTSATTAHASWDERTSSKSEDLTRTSSRFYADVSKFLCRTPLSWWSCVSQIN